MVTHVMAARSSAIVSCAARLLDAAYRDSTTPSEADAWKSIAADAAEEEKTMRAEIERLRNLVELASKCRLSARGSDAGTALKFMRAYDKWKAGR